MTTWSAHTDPVRSVLGVTLQLAKPCPLEATQHSARATSAAHSPVQSRADCIVMGTARGDVQDDAVIAFFSVISDPRDRAIFMLMVQAGLRVGEVVALDLNSVEHTQPPNLNRLRVRGKGDRERIAWLTEQTWVQLDAWVQARPAGKDPALFLNQHHDPVHSS